MRYFDRMLSEALDEAVDPPKAKRKKGLHGQRLYDEMKRRFEDIGDQKEDGADEQELDRRWQAFDDLATEDNMEEFQAFEKKIADENRHNKKFIKALEHRAHKGDNLVTWMLRHLVNKAQSG